MNANKVEIHDHTDIDLVIKDLDLAATQALNVNKIMYVQYGTDKGMTKTQRGALHVWCQMVADTLNDAGLPHVYDSQLSGLSIEIDWTMQMIKDMQYKPILKKMSGKDSTEDQTTVEPSDVARTINRLYADKGIVLPAWPSNK